MRISVVVPVFNVEKFLKQCINSIINQTKAAYEIILVDDGSTDSSGYICDEYANKYNNIQVIHQNNAGLGIARNTGLDRVTGDYVTFIDSDDFLDLDFLKKTSMIFGETTCDACKTSFKRVDMSGKFVSTVPLEPGEFLNEQISNQLIPRLIGSAPSNKDSIPMSVCCTVFSTKIIRDNRIRFVSEREWISEDIIFNLEYYSCSNHIILDEYIGYNYRVNTNSLTTRYLKSRFKKCIAMYDKEKQILINMNIYSLCKYRLDRQFFIYLKMCLKQLRYSGLTVSEKINDILEICNNIKVQQILEEYPINQLGFKQKVFVYLIKYKMYKVLYLSFAL